jgi:hypothetical protein
MARVAEFIDPNSPISAGGGLYEVVMFAEDFFTGKDTVVLRRYWQSGEDILKNAYNYGVWTMTVEYFKQNFRWVNA